jgi:protoporphyrin/coproporphyrin ferrochelatase
MSRGVLLVNLGSPASPEVADVRRYLAEFLSDSRVLDLPKLLQQILLRCIILPRRAPASAEAYASIWTPQGSPLVAMSRRLQEALGARVDVPVELAMRYGEPSIASSVERLLASNVRRLFLVPLYPHYAMSSYETVVARVREVARELHPELDIVSLPPFYDHAEYIDALHESAKPFLYQSYDHVLFSYHGLPVRHLVKADSSRIHCTRVRDCCSNPSPAHATCYRAQTIQTTRAFVRRAGIPDGKWSLAYQSRLAGEPWLEPYTEQELVRLAESGVRRLLVLTPAFVADCLETLEEVAERGRRTFLDAGGVDFARVPCLNDHPAWVDFLERRIDEWLRRESL